MQRSAKKAVLVIVVLGLCYAIVEILRSPQADTRRIAQEKRRREGTWNGAYDTEDAFEPYRYGW